MAVAVESEWIDRPSATDLARLALRDQSAEILDWSLQPVAYDASNPVSLGVHRLAGTATLKGKQLCWSLILKVIRSPVGVEIAPGITLPAAVGDPPPGHFSNWRREILAYQSGVLRELPEGLAAPRCFRLEEKIACTYWVWLEDVADAFADSWTPARYGVAAHCLGRFNGAYLTGHPLPSEPWLGDGWQRSWIADMEQCGGWDGDELEIRFGCAASAALRYSFTKAYYAAMDMVDPARRSHVEAQTGQQIEAVSRREASRLSFLLDLADEARTLLPRLRSAR
jgi:hypothetical protein